VSPVAATIPLGARYRKQRRQGYCPNTSLLQGPKSYLRWIFFALASLHFFVLSSSHGPIRSQVN